MVDTVTVNNIASSFIPHEIPNRTFALCGPFLFFVEDDCRLIMENCFLGEPWTPYKDVTVWWRGQSKTIPLVPFMRRGIVFGPLPEIKEMSVPALSIGPTGYTWPDIMTEPFTYGLLKNPAETGARAELGVLPGWESPTTCVKMGVLRGSLPIHLRYPKYPFNWVMLDESLKSPDYMFGKNVFTGQLGNITDLGWKNDASHSCSVAYPAYWHTLNEYMKEELICTALAGMFEGTGNLNLQVRGQGRTLRDIAFAYEATGHKVFENRILQSLEYYKAKKDDIYNISYGKRSGNVVALWEYVQLAFAHWYLYKMGFEDAEPYLRALLENQRSLGRCLPYEFDLDTMSVTPATASTFAYNGEYHLMLTMMKDMGYDVEIPPFKVMLSAKSYEWGFNVTWNREITPKYESKQTKIKKKLNLAKQLLDDVEAMIE